MSFLWFEGVRSVVARFKRKEESEKENGLWWGGYSLNDVATLNDH